MIYHVQLLPWRKRKEEGGGNTGDRGGGGDDEGGGGGLGWVTPSTSHLLPPVATDVIPGAGAPPGKGKQELLHLLPLCKMREMAEGISLKPLLCLLLCL